LERVVVIPARGGSKGIPRKNLKEVDGLPLVIRAALLVKEAKNVDEVFVSTEDSEIKEVCYDYGVEVIDRPRELSEDETSTDAVIEHTLTKVCCDVLGLVQCTAPLLKAADVERVIKAVECGADSAIAASKFHGFLWTLDGEGINHDGFNRARRQDMEPQYLETGSVYAINPKMFKISKTRFCGWTEIVEVEPGIEIDELADLELARLIMGG